MDPAGVYWYNDGFHGLMFPGRGNTLTSQHTKRICIISFHTQNISDPHRERNCLWKFWPRNPWVALLPVPSMMLAATWTDAWRARNRPGKARVWAWTLPLRAFRSLCCWRPARLLPLANLPHVWGKSASQSLQRQGLWEVAGMFGTNWVPAVCS